MSRRDTIIVAVLINTGLLAALFMMATQQDVTPSYESRSLVQPDKNTEQVQEAVGTSQNKEPRKEIAAAATDEIDEVIKHYSAVHAKPVVIREEAAVEKKETALFSEVYPSDEASLPAGDFVEVKVKKGDYLEKIARSNGTTVSAIMKANRLQSPKIAVGQTLLIPIVKKSDADVPHSQKPSQLQEARPPEPEYYTVKSGDNPWKIARQFHVKFEDLLKLNDLDEAKARNLKPGDVLRVK